MIKGWKKFNEELETQTYREAGYKLDRLGHEKRAKNLFSHAEAMIVKKSKEKYGIDTCEFENGVVANFAGFDFGMGWECYFDNDEQHLSIPVFFQFPEEWDGDTIFSPISFEYDVDEDKLTFFGMSEEAMVDLYGKDTLKFKSRKDAMKVINTLKRLDLKAEITWKHNQDEFERFQDTYKKLLSKIRINELFVS
jgi:hypothetical protein